VSPAATAAAAVIVAISEVTRVNAGQSRGVILVVSGVRAISSAQPAKASAMMPSVTANPA
jgi:hypothetical protein